MHFMSQTRLHTTSWKTLIDSKLNKFKKDLKFLETALWLYNHTSNRIAHATYHDRNTIKKKN